MNLTSITTADYTKDDPAPQVLAIGFEFMDETERRAWSGVAFNRLACREEVAANLERLAAHLRGGSFCTTGEAPRHRQEINAREASPA